MSDSRFTADLVFTGHSPVTSEERALLRRVNRKSVTQKEGPTETDDTLLPLGDLERPRDLQDVQDVYPNARACPFPYSDERPNAAEIYSSEVSQKEVKLSRLWATQYVVDKDKVKKILHDLQDGKYDDNPNHADKIAVVHDQKTGRYLIMNGHHHATALLLHGKKDAHVVVHIEVKR
jgi:hypothetical protein